MHLDADENWHVGGDVDIYTVALHEAGHAIGLGHSDKPGDVMYPYYRRGMALSANDIGAARALYGMPSGTIPAPVTNPPATTLHLTLDSLSTSTSNPVFSATGVVTGGVGPYTVQWMSDHGYSGKASFGSPSAWAATDISLVNGENTISFTAFDSSDQSSTQSATVNLVPAPKPSPGTGSTSPVLPIAISISAPSSPVLSTNARTLNISGTSSGGAGITRVTWQSSTGSAGNATGTSHWSATSIPLLTGINTIVVRAYDANGSNAWAAVVAVRN
jgi:hypothetical protein